MTASIYETGEYLSKNPTWHVEDAPWKAAQVCRMLERNHMRPATFCEIGCGAGAVLADLQRRCGGDVRLWGYEISPQAYEMCQERANDHLSFVLGDITARQPSRCFDVLLMLDVVEHVDDHMRFLRQVRPLGVAKIFHFPLDLSAQSVLRGIPSKVRRTAGHVHYFTKELVLQTLEDAGYRVIDHFYTPAALENQSPSLKTRLMRLPRRLSFAVNPDAAALCFGGFSLLVLAI